MKYKRPFTLIELLVVIVLISMLVGITVPVYTRVMTGNAVSYGMRQVVSQLNMARVEACRSRRKVAVIFLMKKWEDGDTVPDDKDGIYNRRAFRACYVDSSYEFEKWIPGSKWETLPKGAFLATNTQSGFVSSNDVTYTRIKDDPPDRLFSADTTFQHAIIFDATGRPPVGSSTPQVVIAEGTINSNAPEETPTAALTDANDNIYKPNLDNWAVCKVNLNTGKVKAQMNDAD